MSLKASDPKDTIQQQRGIYVRLKIPGDYCWVRKGWFGPRLVDSPWLATEFLSCMHAGVYVRKHYPDASYYQYELQWRLIPGNMWVVERTWQPINDPKEGASNG